MSVNASTRTKSRLETAVLANDLATYTIKITTNEKIFLPQYRSALTDKIVSDAVDIYRCVWTANNIRVTDRSHWIRRSALQKKAVEHCNDLLALIGIAKPLFHLTSKRIEYWTGKTIKVREAIKDWHDSDRDRYKNV